MKIENYYGKELERLDVGRVEYREDTEFTDEDFPILFDHMYLLDPEDRDLMLLIYVNRKRQEDIGKLFGVTQEAVSYQVKKLRSRIKFIKKLREIQPHVAGFFDHVKGLGIPAHFVETAALMFFTTSQTASARVLGVKQATVRYRYRTFIGMLEGVKIPKRFARITRYLKGLLKYHNRVKRIRRG